MGGWGSGGQNKTHYPVESWRRFRIDSFAFADHIRYDKYAHCKSVIKVPAGNTHILYHTAVKCADLYEYGGYHPLELSRVTNIDGRSQRVYFLCPCCDRRVRYLYMGFDGRYKCRTCSKLNYKSQQVSGMEEMRLKMRRIVEEKLGYYGWEVDFDCIADLPTPPKPAYMRWEKYNALALELETLQADYYTEFCRHLIGTSTGRHFKGGTKTVL